MLRLFLPLLYLLVWSFTMPQTDQGGSADPLGGPNRIPPSHGETDGGGSADPLG